MTIVDVGELLAVLSATYPNATLTEKSPEVWHVYLREYDTPTVLASLRGLLDGHPDFCPTPIRFAKDLDAILSNEKPVEVVWSEVMKIVARIGNPDRRTAGLRDVAEIDPLAAEVIDQGITWFALSSTPVDKNDSLYRRFRDGMTEARKARRQDATRETVAAVTTGMPALNGAAHGR